MNYETQEITILRISYYILRVIRKLFPRHQFSVDNS